MLPKISYKIHPKMQQIIQQKRKRRQLLEMTRLKELNELSQLKVDRKTYMEQNKNQIQLKQKQIYERKLTKRNMIREQEKERQARIAVKKAQRLMKLLPQRKILIQQLRESYLQFIKEKDKSKQQKIQALIDQRIQQANQQYSNVVPLSEKIKQNNIIDINEGICILCLTNQAQIYMTECRHLISCNECEFIVRMQKKCPVCRKVSKYQSLTQNKFNKNKSKK